MSAYITAGSKSSLIFAADTVDVSCDGHISQYLGATESIYLQIPTKDGNPPRHKILHMGPCAVAELPA